MPIFLTNFDSGLNALFSHPPFDALNPPEREKLVKKARGYSFVEDDVVYVQGQDDVQFSYVLSGQLKLCCSASQGRECVLHIIRPDTIVDAGVLFFEGGLPYSAVGISPGMLCVFDKKVIFELLAENSVFVLKVMRLLAARERLYINKLAGSQGRISVSARVSSWLLHRSRMEKSSELKLDMNRELMARLLGVSRESLSRELSRLAELGHIKVERRSITILDPTALKKLASS